MGEIRLFSPMAGRGGITIIWRALVRHILAQDADYVAEVLPPAPSPRTKNVRKHCGYAL